MIFRIMEHRSEITIEAPVESLGTVDKAVDVLFALHGAARPQGVTALARSLGLPKSSTHRLLATLARRLRPPSE